MDPLQNINGLLQEYQKLERGKTVKRTQDAGSSLNTESVREQSQTAESAKDTVLISDDSKTALEREKDVSRYMQELESIKTIDEKQLAKIRNRLESGYYNEPAVMEKVMHDVLVSSPLTISNAFDMETREKTAARELDNPDLAAIRENIQNKVYDSDQVLNTVVNKILGIE